MYKAAAFGGALLVVYLQLAQTVNVCTFSIRRDPLAASYNYVILLGL